VFAPPSLAERFHDATKYTPARIGRHPGVDPSRQPVPFKEWHQARLVALPRSGQESGHPAAGPLDLARLGRLLLHAYGITAVARQPGMTHYLRASPSAGGLYPTELYLAARAVKDLPDGIYGYRAREHALACCWEGDFSEQLRRYAFDHPALEGARAVLIATGVFERSAWRYHDRAYRRILLDTGHVLGNAVLAAPCEGLQVVPIADFADDALDGLLLLDPEQEGCLLLGAMREGSAAPMRRAGRSPARPDLPAPLAGRWIRALHDATRMSERSDPAASPAAPAPASDVIALCAAEALTSERVPAEIRRRRSTRQFASDAALPLDDLGRILAYAYPRPGTAQPRADLAPEILDTWVVAAGVQGLAPGAYRSDRERHALALVRRGDPRPALHAGCLGQELGRDAAFAVLHTSRLAAAVASHGERAYRYLHLEAGLLGERLDLAALALGHGASGIGGFFDDDLAALVGLEPDHAVVYVTVVGAPAQPAAG
jgi:SagB-type dehydrogenase family enzyme